MGKTVTLGLIAITVLSIALGMSLESKPFLENLLAETAGVAGSIFVALTLVERIIKSQRSRQWQRVSSQTIRAIHAHTTDVSLPFYMLLPVPERTEQQDFLQSYYHSEVPTLEGANSLKKLAQHILASKERLSEPLVFRTFWGWQRMAVAPR